MTSGPVLRTIVGFAVPLTVANLLQQSYVFVDSLVVGRYLGDRGLAAVGASGPLLYVLGAVFTGIATGFSIRLATMRGAGQEHRMPAAVVGLAGAALGWAVACLLLVLLLATPVLHLTGIHGATAVASTDFQHALAPGYLAFYGLGGVCAFLRGLGEARAPMVLLITCSMINIVLVWWFVGPLHLGVRGAAWATVAANAVATVAGILYTARRHPMPLRSVPVTDVTALLRSAVRLGSPVTVQHLLIGVGMAFLLWIIAPFGNAVLAAVTVVTRMEAFTAMIFFDLSGALTLFVAQNLGAARTDRVRAAVRRTTGLATVLTLAGSAVVVAAAAPIARPFSVDAGTQRLIAHYIVLTYPFFVFYTLMVIWHGAMNGAARTTVPLVCTVVSFAVVRLPLSYLLRGPWGVDGVIWMIDVGWVVGFVYTAVVVARHRFSPASPPARQPVGGQVG